MLLCAPSGSGWTVYGQEIDENAARKVGAAYIFNFAKFIRWPNTAFENEGAPLVIGIQSDDALAQMVARAVRGKTVRGRAITTLRLGAQATPAERGQCHILYLGSEETVENLNYVQEVSDGPTLVVSHSNRFASKGGMIGFVLRDGKIHFEINRDVLESVGLKASAKLLKLARIVKTDQ